MLRHVVVVVVVAALALALASACGDDPLGPAATSECAPLDDPAVRITSEGLTSDGHHVVILGEGSAARVFYGIAAHMVEGAIESTKPGCALEVAFEVQGRTYVATFSPDAMRCMVASSLVSGEPGASARTPLTLVQGGGAPLMFYCL